MSAGNIDALLDLWRASLLKYGGTPPFSNHVDLYRTIDSTPLGEVRWQCFTLRYPEGNVPGDGAGAPSWMTDSHEVWYRDPRAIIKQMLANPDFKGQLDYAPLREFSADGTRRLCNFMSGDWAWRQAVRYSTPDILAQDAGNRGAAFVPVILGSDKTTVSVATGQNDYYPLYISIGNVHNTTRRAHRNAVALAAFLAIPKSTRKYDGDLKFRKFRRQLFHSSLSRILFSLREYMEHPELVQCADGQFRRVIYGLGPYIADYPEQALLGCIVQGWCATCLVPGSDLTKVDSVRRSRQHTETLVETLTLGELWKGYGIIGDVVPFTNDFPRADIHELIAPDILHQLIKGTFKDHLVKWIERYMHFKYGQTRGDDILTQIDRRLAVVPPFSQLRRFREGRGFKQWTGDDSKALMKIYLPALHGHVPTDAIRSVRSFLEFCYIARRSEHFPATIEGMQDACSKFWQYREIFRSVPGVLKKDFNLPRQHSMLHYERHIWNFGAPSGLCTSITESKHIKAVKEPWRRSNRYEALGQMLLTNQRMDKLAMSRVHYEEQGMLAGTCLQAARLELGTSQIGLDELGMKLGAPSLTDLIRHFLFHQLHPDGSQSGATLSINDCPPFNQSVFVHSSAEAVFYAPSDPSGIAGMRREFIRATSTWRKGSARYDCVYVNRDSTKHGLLGLDVARVRTFLSFKFEGVVYNCAVVHWFQRTSDRPDEDTGMWIVKPSYIRGRRSAPLLSVIHIDTIYRAAHLIGVSNGSRIELANLHYTQSLDVFERFYVNKFIDHHAFDLLHTY
ncbi:hypothetical protein C2E23DRAFT_719558 [Lenzites betulinus]|nr:hypothetical protein C2E23DRAFT_719558 [Lenzites betulinus]